MSIRDNNNKKYNEVFTIIGASTHSDVLREKKDFYSSPPQMIDYLLKYEKFSKNIWECACGNGNLSKRLEYYGYDVKSTDLVYRGYGKKESVDFLKQKEKFKGDIITNPPFKFATEFALKSLELTNRKVALVCRIQFLESQRRYDEIFKEQPPKNILIFVKRLNCYRNNSKPINSSAICYCWIIWDKKYNGDPKIKWIDNRVDDYNQQKLVM